jgi:hypothetical protein
MQTEVRRMTRLVRNKKSRYERVKIEQEICSEKNMKKAVDRPMQFA